MPLDDIARRAGVGAGTVYRHFPTKEALFEAVILDRITRFVDHARKLATAEDPGAAFIEFLHHLVAGAASSRDMVDALGGVDVCLSTNLDDIYYPDYSGGYHPIHFKAGCQHLSGEQALEIARSRHANQPQQASDFGRAGRP